MIQSFKDKRTRDIYDGLNSKDARRFDARLLPIARRKLDYINAAKQLHDLALPPGNRLETLSGNRAGFHSIRMNDQWRIVFRWNEGSVEDVEICDYH